MGSTVEELQERMSSREFSEWQIYEELEPLPEYRADARSAMLLTMLANYMREKGGRRYRLDDFMPWGVRAKPIRGRPTEELKAMSLSLKTTLTALTRRGIGKIRKRRGRKEA